jgi:hypothetical protein
VQATVTSQGLGKRFGNSRFIQTLAGLVFNHEVGEIGRPLFLLRDLESRCILGLLAM